MKRKCEKAIRRAYHKGREESFDHGINVAKMIYNEIVVALKQEIEALNSEIIVNNNEEEDEDAGIDS